MLLPKTLSWCILFLIVCQCYGQRLDYDLSKLKLKELKESLAKSFNKHDTDVAVKLITELQRQNWGGNLGQGLSEPCINGTNYLKTHYKTNGVGVNMSLRAFAFDAYGKPGAGLFEGNIYAYGSYDECLWIEKTQYCASPVAIAPNYAASQNGALFTFAMCVPSECSVDDVVKSTEAINTTLETLNLHLYMNASDVTCQKDKKPPYTTGAIVMIAVCSFFAYLTLLGTTIDWLINVYDHVRHHLKRHDVHMSVNADAEKEVNVSEKTPLLGAFVTEQKKKTTSQYLDLITAFSLFKTVPTILSTKQPASAISSINGMRVISMFWVILGHTHAWSLSRSANIAHVLGEVGPRFTFQAVVNGTFSVDTFFFLSGLLMAYLTLRQMARRQGRFYKRFPFLMYYLHRYLRLTPTYAFVVFFWWFMTMYLADGPYYSTVVNTLQAQNCEKYWWTNFLYINNFYPWKLNDECMGWVWYLANDMQFYVISPVMVIALFYSLPVGLISVSVLLVASFISTGAIAGHYGFDNSLLSAKNANISVSPQDEIYSKPYTRISPYLVGIVIGYLLYRKVRIPLHKLINWLIYLPMWGFAAFFLMAPLYGLYGTWHGHPLNDAENVLYYTFSRFSWGIGLALIVFACHNGYGFVVNSFLSMKIWVPLSRLTFTAYLVHPIVLTVIYGCLRSPFYYMDITMAAYAVAAVGLSYGAAAVVAVFVEFPLSNLEAALFKLVGLGVRESTRRVTEPSKNGEERNPKE